MYFKERRCLQVLFLFVPVDAGGTLTLYTGDQPDPLRLNGYVLGRWDQVPSERDLSNRYDALLTRMKREHGAVETAPHHWMFLRSPTTDAARLSFPKILRDGPWSGLRDVPKPPVPEAPSQLGLKW